MINPEEVQPPFECQQVDVDGIQMHIPFLRVRANGEGLILHPFNTLVRQFEDESLDHLEVTIEGDKHGIPMDEEILDQFLDYDFSYRWDRRPDKSTIIWLVSVAMANIDEEYEMLGDQDES